MKRLIAEDIEPVSMLNIVTTPATVLYMPSSFSPRARSITRDANSPTAISRNIRKYRRTVFRAILLLFSDMLFSAITPVCTNPSAK